MPELYSYQRKAVDWIAEHPKMILADEMGLGKTAQAIVAAKDADPTIIVCGSGPRYFWRSEIIKWTQCDPASIYIVGEQRVNPDAKWWITSWDSLAQRTRKGKVIDDGNTAFLNDLMKRNKITADAIIADEAHKMKNRKAARSMAIKGLNSDMKMLLTGTPIVNEPAELWSLLNYLDRKEFSSYWRFFHSYVRSIPNVFGGYEILGVQNVEELHEILRHYVIRRRVRDVYKQLPERIHTSLPVKLTPKQRASYDELKKTMETTIYSSKALEVLANDGDIDSLDESDIRELMTPTALALLTRLRQIALSTGTLVDDLGSESPKLDMVMDLLEERDTQQTVITSQFRWAIAAMEKRLTKQKISYGIITGDVPDKKRNEYVEDFQNGQLQVMLMTTQTGGESWTLSAADAMIFIDKPVSPAVLWQAEERLRAHRQGRVVKYYSIHAEDTVEDRIEELLERKREMFTQIFGAPR